MRITGFYIPDPGGSIDMIGFLITNIAGMASTINPDAAPRILLADVSPLSREWENIPLLYYPDEIEFCLINSQEKQKAKNAFIIDEKKVAEVFGKINDPVDALLALWQALLHEIRHFAQFNFLDKTDRLGPSLVREIKKINPEAGEKATQRLSSYIRLPKDEMAAETDAVIIEILGTYTLLATWDGEEFDFNKVKTVLLKTRNDYRANPCLFLEVFKLPLAA